MRYSSGATAYKEAKVLGSSPEQLVVLLYEHLLTNLRKAGIQMQNGDLEGRAVSLERASDIVFELLSALDTERGGEIASRLAALYAYFISEIGALSRQADDLRLDRMVNLVASLHESWTRAAAASASAAEAGGAA
jgi:flagellar secretion chaperone FliS